MADTSGVTSINNDSATPPDASPEPAARKPLNNSWGFPVVGGLFGAYFLVSGALMLREKHGNGVFALLMAGIVVILGVLGGVLYRTWRASRAAPATAPEGEPLP